MVYLSAGSYSEDSKGHAPWIAFGRPGFPWPHAVLGDQDSAVGCGFHHFWSALAWPGLGTAAGHLVWPGVDLGCSPCWRPLGWAWPCGWLFDEDLSTLWLWPQLCQGQDQRCGFIHWSGCVLSSERVALRLLFCETGCYAFWSATLHSPGAAVQTLGHYVRSISLTGLGNLNPHWHCLCSICQDLSHLSLQPSTPTTDQASAFSLADCFEVILWIGSLAHAALADSQEAWSGLCQDAETGAQNPARWPPAL